MEREYILGEEGRPEELKALNVIIRAVGEPSSNHTQITYTLTPTYNTSHPRVLMPIKSERKREREGCGGLEDEEGRVQRLDDLRSRCQKPKAMSQIGERYAERRRTRHKLLPLLIVYWRRHSALPSLAQDSDQ
ncbi:hypothetical protein EYF80_019290 [Liparis tanakae]|uniref:Uncharacterized protein n=1 Tax=Liparis tanakae TaxID=230148 RepID=A0A4Z2HYZ0_9TELE|nr:hypothetical protein EYF80_019290 [Liparis tanakae]